MLQSFFQILKAFALPSVAMSEIDLGFVRSSSVAAIGFDQVEKTLQVEYLNGIVFQAYGVLKSDYDCIRLSHDFDCDFRKTIVQKYDLDRVAHLVPVFVG